MVYWLRTILRNKIYFVPPDKINEINQPVRKPSDVGELINISCIVGWKTLDGNPRDRQVTSFPLVNPPVI